MHEHTVKAFPKSCFNYPPTGGDTLHINNCVENVTCCALSLSNMALNLCLSVQQAVALAISVSENAF